MTIIKYQVSFFSDWHCGSGLSGGFGVDLIVIRDRDGLPFIPGRTLKGLLRDAAQNLADLDHLNKTTWNNFINSVFGSEGGAEKPGYRPSVCYFSDGQLPYDIKTDLAKHVDLKQFLFRESASTAINKHGIAKEHSLRVKETVIPLTLTAAIHDFPGDDGYMEKLGTCMKWIKRLGVNRNRGLGRCRLEIIPT